MSSMEGYRTLEANGFEQLPTCGNYFGIPEYTKDNMKITIEKCNEIISPDKLAGYMMTTWEKTTAEKKDRLDEAVDMLKEGYELYYAK